MSEPSPGFRDEVFGEIAPGAARGDFVLRRADGIVAYHLAVVVDDIDMGITEVVRGADLLYATSRQIALTRALGAAPPRHLHVPLVLGPDGKRLSKSDGATGVLEHRERGVSAETLLGRLAYSLGITEDATPARASDLVWRFDPTKIVPRDGALGD